jgi:3-hexulose-6-phosphate synthase
MDKHGKVHRVKLSPESFFNEFSKKHTDFNLPDSKITTSQLSDAMRKVTGRNGVLKGIKPIKNGLKIIGKATTAKTSSNDWGTVIEGIYSAEIGDILVIKCDGDDPAVWGEMASKAAQKQGLVGTVIYGACRDVLGIKNLNYPVFSRDIIPNAGKPLNEGEINSPIICGGTTVHPGDIIMGDECGVVSVPFKLVEEVLEEAEIIINTEDKILNQLNDGKSFHEILGMD